MQGYGATEERKDLDAHHRKRGHWPLCCHGVQRRVVQWQSYSPIAARLFFLASALSRLVVALFTRIAFAFSLLIPAF
ncbi:hypothetical protein D3C75_690190 [compost metagenome]